MLVHDFLINSANRFPNKDAIIHGAKRYTYAEVLAEANKLSCWLLERNLDKGFRAALLTDDPFEYITSYFAILLAGGIAVGLNTQTSERTLKRVLNDCTASVIFVHPKFKRYIDKTAPEIISLQAIVINNIDTDSMISFERSQILGEPGQLDNDRLLEVQKTDLAQIIYTSGTTGEPKGVMLTHGNLSANTESIIEYLHLTSDDRIMAVLPFFYSYGNSVLLTHIAAGGSLVVNQNFLYPNVILDEMAKEEVSGFSGVPSTFAILLNRSALKNYSFPALRYITQAGAAMSPSLAQRLQIVFPEVAIYIMYGQTEASARLSYLSPEDIQRKAGSIGKAIPGVTLKLLDKEGKHVSLGSTGEIVAQGANVMAGYWGKPEETAKVLKPEGLWTGDLARMDDDGYLYIVSRKSDMIKTGSHRIAPKEIEEIILEHEAVHEVAVVGNEDEILGEAIKAYVVLKADNKIKEREIVVHCRKNLPAYKVPHQVEFLPELPKTATGKIQKKKLIADGP